MIRIPTAHPQMGLKLITLQNPDPAVPNYRAPQMLIYSQCRGLTVSVSGARPGGPGRVQKGLKLSGTRSLRACMRIPNDGGLWGLGPLAQQQAAEAQPGPATGATSTGGGRGRGGCRQWPRLLPCKQGWAGRWARPWAGRGRGGGRAAAAQEEGDEGSSRSGSSNESNASKSASEMDVSDKAWDFSWGVEWTLRTEDLL